MKKSNRLFALLLALAMVVTYMPSMAFAAAAEGSDDQSVPEAVQNEGAEAEEPETVTQETPELTAQEVSSAIESNDEEVLVTAAPLMVTAKPSVKLDSDELLLGYLDQEVDEELDKVEPTGNGKKAAGAGARSTVLTNAADKALYDSLAACIKDVASGDSASSSFSIKGSVLFPDDDFSYTKEELGVGSLIEGNTISAEAQNAFYAKYELDVDTVLEALLADFPYDLYWYDKTSGVSYGWSGISSDGESIQFADDDPSLELYFAVSADYSATGDKKTYDLNTELTAAAAAFAGNAAAIITDNAEKSDYEKLNAYKEAICEATSYNEEAVKSTYTQGYGDPWQLIYVFDGNEDTKVVCEGYSKAFQFLCERTEFTSNKVAVNSLTGIMSGGTGAGAHMWNIVQMDDEKNYIVDVTNCDDGTIGAPDYLFLTGAVGGTVSTGYNYDCNDDGKSDITYTYDKDTKDLFSEDELTMSADAYDPNWNEGGETEDPVADVQYEQETDREMLVGWENVIDGNGSVFVTYESGNTDYFGYTVSDVEVLEGSDLLDNFEKTDEYWWNYRVKDRQDLGDDFNGGDVIFKVTYNIPEELQVEPAEGEEKKTEDSYEFTVHVVEDYYNVSAAIDNCKDDALPGETLSMTAEADHRYYEKNDEDEWIEKFEDDGFTFKWYYAIGSNQENKGWDDYNSNASLWTEVPAAGVNDSRAVITVDNNKLQMTAGTPGNEGNHEEVYVKTAVVDGDKEYISDMYELQIHNKYTTIYPLELDDMEVGDTITQTFEVREYNSVTSSGGYTNEDGSKTLDEVESFTCIYNEDVFSITENYNGEEVKVSSEEPAHTSTWTITRLQPWWSDIEVAANMEDAPGSQCYGFAEKNYKVWFNNDRNVVYSDGDLTYTLETQDIPDGAKTEFTVVRGNGEELENGLLKKYYTVDEEKGTVTLHGKALADEDIMAVKLRAAVSYNDKVIAATYDAENDDDWQICFVENARIEYYDFYQESEVMPGEGSDFNENSECCIFNTEYPDGEEFSYTVSSVEVTDGEEFLAEHCFEEKDGKYYLQKEEGDEDAWFGYSIKDAEDLDLDNLGDVKMTVSYSREEGGETAEETADVVLHVTKDRFNVWINGTEDGSYTGLPGTSIELSADAVHEYFDADNHYQETSDDICYEWSIEDGAELAELIQDKDDPSKATLKFKELGSEEGQIDRERLDDDVVVKVSVYDADDEEKTVRSSDRNWFRITTEYDQMWITTDINSDDPQWSTINPEIDLNQTVTAKFQLRKYAVRYQSDKYDNKGYVVVTAPDITWDYEKDEFGIELVEGTSDTFKLTRKTEGNTQITIYASYSDNPDLDYDGWDGFECGYEYNWIEYNLNPEGTDVVFTDGEAEFVIETGDLSDGWEDRYDFTLILGKADWNADGPVWDVTLTEGKEYTLDKTDPEKLIIKVDGTKLKDYAGDWFVLYTKLTPKGNDKNKLYEGDLGFSVEEAYLDEKFPDEMKDGSPVLCGNIIHIYDNIKYFGGNSKDGYFDGEYVLSDLTLKSGDSVKIEKVEEGTGLSGWFVIPVKEGESVLEATYTDEKGLGAASPAELTVNVVKDVYEVTLDSADGVFHTDPGSSINLSAYGVHRIAEAVDDEGNWKHSESSEGLTYKWSVSEGEEFVASLTPDSSDSSKAVLKFKSAEDLGDNRGGATVKVEVYDGTEMVAETFDFYSVEDNYTYIEPALINSDADAGDSQIIDLKTMLKENGETRAIPGEINYTWYYNQDAVDIEAVTENDGVAEYTHVADGQTTDSAKFRITRKGSGYTRIVLNANWGMDMGCWHAYYFNQKNYDISIKDADAENVANIVDTETKTFDVAVSGFDGDGYSYTPSLVYWDDESNDFAAITGLTDDQFSYEKTDDGLKVKVSAPALIAKGYEGILMSVDVAKGSNKVYSKFLPIRILTYNDPAYAWSTDCKTVTATAKCKYRPDGNEDKFDITEKVSTSSAVKTAPTKEKNGTTTYTAEFEDAHFTTQTKDVDDIPYSKVEDASTAKTESDQANADAKEKDEDAKTEAGKAADAAASGGDSANSVIAGADAAATTASTAAEAALDAANKSLDAVKSAYPADSQQVKDAEAVVTAAKKLVASTSSTKASVKASAALAASKTATAAKEAASAATSGTAEAVTLANESKTAAETAAKAAAEAAAAAKTALDNAEAAYGTNTPEYDAAASEKTKADSALKVAEEAVTAAQNALTKAKSEEAAAKAKAEAEAIAAAKAKAAAAAAEAKAKKVTTVTVNAKTVKASTIAAAIKAAGGKTQYVKTVVLGKKVKKISASAFKGTKVTTLTVKSKKLTKKGVKKSLKGSSVKTIKVKVGNKKANKTYVKKYKKFFTKKNAGKKVKIK